GHRPSRGGFLLAFAFYHDGPGHSGDLVGKRDRGDLGWPASQQRREPGPLGAMDLGITDDRGAPSREQAAQIAIALLADTAEPVLAAARVLLRHEPDPGREVPPRSEGLRVCNTGDQSGGQRRADAGYLIEPSARLIGSVPGHDLAVKLQDLGFQHPQLNSESGNTTTGPLGHPFLA